MRGYIYVYPSREITLSIIACLRLYLRQYDPFSSVETERRYTREGGLSFLLFFSPVFFNFTVLRQLGSLSFYFFNAFYGQRWIRI